MKIIKLLQLSSIISIISVFAVMYLFSPSSTYAQFYAECGGTCARVDAGTTVDYGQSPLLINGRTPGGVFGELRTVNGQHIFIPFIERGDGTTMPPPGNSQDTGGNPGSSTAPPATDNQKTIYGAVFEDTNKNCVLDSGERLLDDWAIHRGWSAQVNENGNSVPGACWTDGGRTATINADTNYSMTFNPNNAPACNGGNLTLPFQVNASDPEENDIALQPSSQSCGVQAYATNPLTWFKTVRNFDGEQNNRLRIDFPMIKPQVAACGTSCSTTADCSTATDGCTQCRPNSNGQGSSCQQPPTSACNSTCVRTEDCAGGAAREGCSACVTGANGAKTCQQPPSCGTTCTQASDCAGARNGCTACVPDADGSGSSCQQPPSCGAACDRNNSTSCSGVRTSAGGDCSTCRPNSAGQDVCQPPEIACGSACNRNDSSACAGVRTSAGGDCSACLPNANGQAVCQPPIACGTTCTQASDCAGARNGCTACVPNSNGQGSSCQQPPSCGTTCTQASDCAGARNGCTACVPNSTGSGSSCQTPPSCGSACARDDQCTGAQNSAGQTCSDCRPGANGQSSCQPPVACNSSCTKDADCNAGDAKAQGCTSCLPGTNGQLVCKKNIACNSACTKDSDCNSGDALKNGCTSCTENKCQTFSEDMCKCDGIEFTPITNGQEVTVKNYEKVEGPNVRKAMVQDMIFRLTKDNEKITESAPIKATVVSKTADKVRYMSEWKVKIPDNVTPGAKYRIFAQVKCVKYSEITNASVVSTQSISNASVATPTTAPQNRGFFGNIGAFFSRLFGGNASVQSNTPTPTTTATSTPTTNPNNRDSLQLRTFNPNVNVASSCRFINFDFKE